MLVAIIPVMFFSCVKKDDTNNTGSLSIITGDKISIKGPQLHYAITASDYSHTLISASHNSWKTYLLPD